MLQHLRFPVYIFTLLFCLSLWTGVQATDELDKATAAVTNILFDFDANEFTAYVVKDDGWVDITFARNTPDALYSQILAKLKTHPDIPGVLAGKGGPSCPLF